MIQTFDRAQDKPSIIILKKMRRQNRIENNSYVSHSPMDNTRSKLEDEIQLGQTSIDIALDYVAED